MRMLNRNRTNWPNGIEKYRILEGGDDMEYYRIGQKKIELMK